MQIQDAKTALAFIHGGKAIFTLVSLNTGKRYTYKARHAPDGGDRVFVDILVGRDNNADYVYLGFINSPTSLRAGKKGNPYHPAFAALDWMLMNLSNGRMPTTAEFWHEGKCARCGRKLTTPESLQTGFGPECIKKVSA